MAINEMVRRATTLTSGIRRIIDTKIRSIGIDLGKTTFHLVALGERGKILHMNTIQGEIRTREKPELTRTRRGRTHAACSR